MSKARQKIRFAFTFSVLMFLCAGANAQNLSYLALGDSVVFGIADGFASYLPSKGDQGYVKRYADALKTQNGARPAVNNLGVPGETTASLFAPGSSGTYKYLNTNYGSGQPAQYDLMQTRIASEQAAGRTIAYVTAQIGANDIIPSLSLPAAQFQAQFPGIEAAAITRTTTLLTKLRALLPSANLLLIGYYDPYPATDSRYANAEYSLPRYNADLVTLAAMFHARYVDTFTPFIGHQSTYVTSGDIHPTPLGYTVIAQQMTLPITVSGTVALQGIAPAAAPQTLTFAFRPTDGAPAVQRTAAVDSSGVFAFHDIPAQTYTLHTVGTRYLAQNVTADGITANTVSVSINLLAGDADGNNAVNFDDFLALLNAFGTSSSSADYNANADFNADGQINFDDFLLLLDNFDAAGDP